MFELRNSGSDLPSELLLTIYCLAVNSSSSQFILAEQMARRGAPDDRILGVINPPMTQLSLEEQQIQESLMRLDNRLLNIQVCKQSFYRDKSRYSG